MQPIIDLIEDGWNRRQQGHEIRGDTDLIRLAPEAGI